MSQRLRSTQSHPILSTHPAAETGRAVTYARADGYFIRLPTGEPINLAALGDGGGEAIYDDPNPPPSPDLGMLWLDNDEQPGQPVGATSLYDNPNPPPTPAVGMLWVDNDEDPGATDTTPTFETVEVIDWLHADGIVTGEQGVYDGVSRVYSASNKVPVAGILTGGAPTSSGFLRGDGEWIAPTNTEPYIMAVTGPLTVQTGKSRVYFENAYVIESIRASVNTASTGASVIVDVNLNGTSIYGTQANRPTIVAGANTALGGAPTSTSVVSGQYLTIDVDQVGSTAAGADLTVVVRLRRV